MTFIAREISIGTAAVAIGTATPKNTHEITIGNDYNKNIYIGGADVTVGNGYSVPKTEHITVKISNGDILYAISDAAGSDIHLYDFQVDP
jgi:hypothetical protein